MAEYPTINGFGHEHNRAKISIDGEEFLGITSVTYETGLEPGELRGTHPQLLSTTLGQHKATGGFEMWKKDGRRLLALLGPGFGAKRFDIVCSFPGDPSDPVDLITDIIKSARIIKVNQESQEGTDPLKMKFDLHVADVLLDGLSIVPDSLYP